MNFVCLVCLEDECDDHQISTWLGTRKIHLHDITIRHIKAKNNLLFLDREMVACLPSNWIGI
jgi:hypothetical protein